MPKIVICRDEQELQQVELRPGRTTLGRHAGNDIVLDHRAVSGQHAAFTNTAGQVAIEDLTSTNGTFVNSQKVTRQLLQHGDRVQVAKFQIRYEDTRPADGQPERVGVIEVTGGPNAGKSLRLTKPVSTLGRPGVQVVAVARRDGAYYIHHVEGASAALRNGVPLESAPVLLNDGDEVELAGTTMRFRLAPP